MAMRFLRAWIAIVFMVAGARADENGDVRKAQSPPDSSSSDARALAARIDAALAARWAEAKIVACGDR